MCNRIFDGDHKFVPAPRTKFFQTLVRPCKWEITTLQLGPPKEDPTIGIRCGTELEFQDKIARELSAAYTELAEVKIQYNWLYLRGYKDSTATSVSGRERDAEMARANQAEIDNALDTINRIAANTQFGDSNLLDGSSGLQGTASDADVTFLKATSDTSAGSYAVAVTTVAERANTNAGTDQTAALAAAETLTLNGVSISLNAGLDQNAVVDRINEFSGQTGVVADVDGTATRLRTESFGTAATIDVISDTAAAGTSSGFGTTLVQDSGVNIAGTIGGNAATGSGNVLTGSAGASQGVMVSIAEDAADLTSTVTGAQGNITIADNSLIFQIGANQNQTVSISIDSVDSTGLGIGVAGNQFTSLNDISVTSAAGAQDSPLPGALRPGVARRAAYHPPRSLSEVPRRSQGRQRRGPSSRRRRRQTQRRHCRRGQALPQAWERASHHDPSPTTFLDRCSRSPRPRRQARR